LLVKVNIKKKVIDFIKKGQEQGAKIAFGGLPSEQLLKGYFIPPTIFTDVREDMNIWKEEIFGPVVCVKTFKNEQEALELANNSTYGLAAAVMSRDKERCARVANALQAGIVWINCSQPTFFEAPWGGVKIVELEESLVHGDLKIIWKQNKLLLMKMKMVWDINGISKSN